MGASLFQPIRDALSPRHRFVAIQHNGKMLASDVLWARSVFERGRGLLGTRELAPGQDGCLLDPCRQIHCRGMRYPIDTIHLDENGTVVGLEYVDVGKTGARFTGSRSILELAAGEIERCGVRVGDTLSFRPARIG